jgi:hypothetical protein
MNAPVFVDKNRRPATPREVNKNKSAIGIKREKNISAQTMHALQPLVIGQFAWFPWEVRKNKLAIKVQPAIQKPDFPA